MNLHFQGAGKSTFLINGMCVYAFSNNNYGQIFKGMVDNRYIDAQTAPEEMPTLAYRHDFGRVTQASSYALIGYDEIEDIEYFYKRYKGYWAHEGAVSIFDMIQRMNREYSGIMKRCRQLDKTIYDDAFAAGNKQYADILSACYRHVIAAHKLFRDDEGKFP